MIKVTKVASKAKQKCRTQERVYKRIHQSSPEDYEVLYKQETHRDWDLLWFEEHQKYVEQKVTEVEQRQKTRRKIAKPGMSDPAASGLGTQAPQPATPLTVKALGQMMQGLSQAMGVMVTNINNLTTNINLATICLSLHDQSSSHKAKSVEQERRKHGSKTLPCSLLQLHPE